MNEENTDDIHYFSKCPACKEQIEKLICEENSISEFYLSSLNSGIPNEFEYDSISEDPLSFRCPECGMIIFTTEDEAKDFLTPDFEDDDE